MYLPVALILAIAMAASAYAAAGPSTGVSAGWADIPDEPSAIIATGDFNRDGIADMVEATSQGRKDSRRHFLTVLLGRADGTFATVASDNLIGSDPRAMVVGDFNGDGNPDVIVGDSEGALTEFLGDGRGNMASAGNIASVGSVVSIASGHFTHDGNLDLVVSDVRSNSAAILLGAGDGSFRLTWSFQLPRKGAQFHIATADFNKDGLADLVIASEDSDDYEVMLGNGNGTFTYAPELSHLRDPYSYCPS
jgi:hypothetical protein